MVIGEGKGNEPTGKSFAFGVIEEGKLIPHMVKVRITTFSFETKKFTTDISYLAGRCNREQNALPRSTETPRRPHGTMT